MKCNIYTVDGHMETVCDDEITYDDFVDDILPCYKDGWITFDRDGRKFTIQIKHIVRIVELKE